MSKSVTEIESGVQRHARDGNISLTTTEGLEVVNRVYRALQAAWPWPELRRQNTSLSTTAGQDTLTWPAEFIVMSIRALEIQDGDDGDKYKLIALSESELNWNILGQGTAVSVPQEYRRSSDNNGAFQLELRPTPLSGGKTIRITGILEHSLSAADSTTIFHQVSADDAFELLLAVDFLQVDGEASELAALNQGKADQLLQRLFG